MITLICKKCGNKFQTYKAWLRKGGGQFCSKSCHSGFLIYSRMEALRAGRKKAIEAGVRIGRPNTKVDLKCAHCGKPFKAHASELNRDRKFCGQECFTKSGGRRGPPKGYTNPKTTGPNHYNWRGGATKMAKYLRHSMAYRRWRDAVFARDKRTCVLCGSKDRIQADHIKSFAEYPELRLSLENGRTLCEPCHKKTPTYGRIPSKKEIR